MKMAMLLLSMKFLVTTSKNNVIRRREPKSLFCRHLLLDTQRKFESIASNRHLHV